MSAINEQAFPQARPPRDQKWLRGYRSRCAHGAKTTPTVVDKCPD